MSIKSLEELRKIRDEYSDRINFRKHGERNEEKIEILIGMATCGISSGARETLNKFVEVIKNEKLENVRVIPVGCIGYCHSEPTVEVHIPGQKLILYGNVKANKVNKIVKEHIIGGKPIESLILNVDFERI